MTTHVPANPSADPHGDKRCTAPSSRTGKPCRAYRVPGAVVCKMHGGAAPQVQAAAKRRLQQAADALAARLLGIALDEGTSESVRLAAIRDALDRGGVTAKAEVEVAVGPTPAFKKVFEGLARGVTREESRRARGLPTQPALAPATLEVVDAEVVEPAETRPESDGDERTGAERGDGRKRPPPWHGEPPPTAAEPAPARSWCRSMKR